MSSTPSYPLCHSVIVVFSSSVSEADLMWLFVFLSSLFLVVLVVIVVYRRRRRPPSSNPRHNRVWDPEGVEYIDMLSAYS